MLANLLHKFMASQAVVETTDSNNWRDYLVAGDTAQFAAGALYALSGQYIDERDYLPECSEQNKDLDEHLVKAFESYIKKDYEMANKIAADTEKSLFMSMKDCDKTNPFFYVYSDNIHKFFEADDWKTTVDVNYKAQKNLVD